MNSIDLRPVRSQAELRTFIELPRRLHRADPRFVPQLDMVMHGLLDKRSSPFLQASASTAWLAVAGGEVVGRLLAVRDEKHLATHDDGAGHFGFLDAADDQSVFDALFAAAEQWFRDHGLRKAVGPFSPSINYESGMEIEGLGEPPAFGMNYAPSYYSGRVAAAGYAKAIDLYSFCCATGSIGLQPQLAALVARGAQSGLTVRMLRPQAYEAEIELLIDIYNDGWAQNWGAVPMQNSEAKRLGAELRPFLRPEWVQFVEKDGAPIAAALQMPDLNEAARDLNGHLFPLGWLKLLWRMRRPTVRNSRMLLLGVRRQWHSSALAPIAALMLIDTGLTLARRHGIERAELGWVLETNKPMLTIVGRFAGMRRKTYRIFEKSL